MNEQTKQTLAIADSWVNFSNKADMDGLSEVTSNQLELVGPKGKGVINHQELYDWMQRAKLQLKTECRYARDHYVVLAQHGTWFNDDDTIKGEAVVYTVLKVENGKVCFLARYDDLESALRTSGLSEGDKIEG
ncbi:hypothetical protein [Halobacillus sp. A5]|uniref:hypothetical protein n=1 Tax=Halobacillus sp. A5 TaxID=2880263 RepID=UPI0020A63C20|nr:hypothetical protein [Halobacillus sp. A5]MCP3027101.1 hypothetical protein [Halobacillus sp. A5]